MIAAKDDQHYRIYSIRPPRDDSGEPFANTDCQHDDLAHLFFAPHGERNWDRTTREHLAREVCAECPFLIECALHGLEHEEYGIWGGLSETDRHVLGGRAVLPHKNGRPPGLPRVIGRLANAGISLADVKTLLRRWKWRRREISKGAA